MGLQWAGGITSNYKTVTIDIRKFGRYIGACLGHRIPNKPSLIVGGRKGSRELFEAGDCFTGPENGTRGEKKEVWQKEMICVTQVAVTRRLFLQRSPEH